MGRWLFPSAAFALAILAVTAGGHSSRAGAQPTACTPHWQVVAHRGVPRLSAIVALSPKSVWAAGGSGGGISTPGVDRPVIVHWDGRRLHTQRFPWKNAEFSAMAAASPHDVWAVGAVGSVDSTTPLVVHWDGQRWQRVQLPPVMKDAWLTDVAAAAADDVWAVGVIADSSYQQPHLPLVLHWDGTAWQLQDPNAVVPPPSVEPGAEYLYELGSGLNAVSVASTGDVWAAGNTYSVDFAGYDPVVVHWNQGAWENVPTPPHDGGVEALDARALAPNNVWTLDKYVDVAAGDEWRYRLIHWQGDAPRVYDYTTSGADVSAIGITSRTSVWIVGTRWSNDGMRPLGPLIIHWNGKTIQGQRTVLDSLRDATLTDISVMKATDVWAAGSHLIARYSC